MNDHDLSLLTDEERKKYNALPFAVEEVAIDDIRDVFHALIAARAENKRLQERKEYLSGFLEEAAHAAASGKDPQQYLATQAPTTLRDELAELRAENKRKDEMLRSLEWSGSYWDSVSGEVLSVCPECDAPHSDMGHLVDCKLDTLLQSEKGGE